MKRQFVLQDCLLNILINILKENILAYLIKNTSHPPTYSLPVIENIELINKLVEIVATFGEDTKICH